MLRQKMQHRERGFVKRVKQRKTDWRKSEIKSLKKLAAFRKLFFIPLPGGQRFHTHQGLPGGLFLLRSLRHVSAVQPLTRQARTARFLSCSCSPSCQFSRSFPPAGRMSWRFRCRIAPTACGGQTRRQCRRGFLHK